MIHHQVRLLTLAVCCWPALAPGAAPPDFVRDIQPVFVRHCLECHGEKKQKSGLRLDRRDSPLLGGDSGQPAIVPGRSAGGSLLRHITSPDPEERMPPKGERVSAAEVSLIRAWIDAGAVWPSNSAAAAPRPHWAFQAPRPAPVPPVKNRSWIRNPIDAFVLARLEKEKIKPAPEADRPTLLRRLSLDLTGLPPTPAEAEAFVHDRRRDAYERLVDHLLASPHFGERWARHWLDLARYADSAGHQIDRTRHGAWLYRDWVIDAINRDQPFDQFTLEQLAGDLLPEATFEQKLATGFHRNTLMNYEDGVDQEEFLSKAKVDRVSTTGTTWLGLTIGCAECHTHKYDPVSQREFYQLYAFFNQSAEIDAPTPPPAELAEHHQAKKNWDTEMAAAQATLAAYLKTELPRQLDAWEKSAGASTHPTVAEILQTSAGHRTAAQQRDLLKFHRDRDPGLKHINNQIRALEKRRPRHLEARAMLLVARTNAPKTFVHVRGDFLRRGEEVQPGVIAALHPFRPRGAAADRLDLARWIVDPANPLTSRVAVNHVWQHLFGRGLVATPEDFGTRGDAPSHPELLDWLALAFQAPRGPAPADGWSRKELIRLIVTSATYRQSSHLRPELAARDPQNDLLARQNRFRVEAELVRDLHLAAGGLLNPSVGGPSIRPKMPADLMQLGYVDRGIQWPETTGPEKYRRGLYVQTQRTVPYPVPLIFDAANASECSPRRERSTTPLQALTLWNNSVFFECGVALGRRLESEFPGGPRQKIQGGFRLCLGRDPARDELNRLERLFADERRATHGQAAPAWTAVAQVILNLDEFLTRE